MQIETVNSFFLKEYKNQKNKSETVSRNKTEIAGKNNPESVQIDISEKGKVLSDQIQTMKLAMAYLKDINDVRQDKLQEVRNKIQDGFYQPSSSIHDLVANRLLPLLED